MALLSASRLDHGSKTIYRLVALASESAEYGLLFGGRKLGVDLVNSRWGSCLARMAHEDIRLANKNSRAGRINTFDRLVFQGF